MINEKNRVSIFRLAIISLALSFFACIPFGGPISKAELIIKFIILPVVILVMNIIISIKKFDSYRPTDRAVSMMSYVPVFTYLIVLSLYTVFLISKASPIAAGSFNRFFYISVALGFVCVGLLLIMLIVDKFAVKMSKFSVTTFDTFTYIFFVVDLFALYSLVFKEYQDAAFTKSYSSLTTFVCIVLGLIIVMAFLAKMYSLYKQREEFIERPKEEIIEEWRATVENEAATSELILLYSMFNYTTERLSIDKSRLYDDNKVSNQASEEVIKKLAIAKAKEKASHERNVELVEAYKELKNQVKVELAQSELNAKKHELELVLANIEKENAEYEQDLRNYEDEMNELEQKISNLATEKASLEAKPEEEETTKLEVPTVKKEKVFAYPYKKLVQFATKLKDVTVSVNPKGNLHKFMIDGKAFLITQLTSSDYRVSFLAKDEDLVEYLQGFPGLISVANTPKDGNWLKVVNKGELEQEFLTKLTKESLENRIAYEEALAKAKEEARLAKEAEKEAEAKRREEEKLNREKIRMAEKILANREKDDEKARKEAEKLAKQAEKEAEKLVKQAEKEAEKLVKQAEKEAENLTQEKIA